MSSSAINIVLVHPQIPQNTGSIGRLCVGLDASLHIIRPMSFNITERNVRRAGLDYWQYLKLTLHNDWESFLTAEQPDLLCFASTKATSPYTNCQFKQGCYIVFGSESHGLPADFYQRYASQLYRIPMPGPHARSINLANSVAIIMYEAHRQLELNP
jgi:tRNA (cytidine/uridine-2'-O-)-methyltransferase